ncbi:hypothetical protein CJD36_019805 [Flavipsychrobacter stenotrophus]|uniref:Uncharacterized protein n=1 Tax=Flavipsychrobacter stenotrophus TaxID=2077091 RepID=A0A2S7SS99_9BACT|nr:hypothetical protein [Flavipsychrobacter stenotrophus]PQJ09487.1 hypothetical protein CJD36_019805 [Flavipsychrobacter stenotrophus]
MSFWQIVYEDLVKDTTPTLLRKRKWLAWLNVLVSPIKWQYDAFTAYRNYTLYLLSHNGQVVSLQAVLNDAFDPIDRQIYIDDTDFPENIWLALDAELDPVWLPLDGEGEPVWLATDDEVANAGSGPAFKVRVPVAVSLLPIYSEYRLRGLVDTYRLAGKSIYVVVTF